MKIANSYSQSDRTEPTRAVWREEFSVHASEDRYVLRRQFTKFLVLTSAGMFAGNLWVLVKSWFARAGSSYGTKIIAPADSVGVGQVKLFTYPTEKDPCILVRTSVDTYVAYSQKCTHLSCAVYYAPQHQRLECPCHEGYFSIADGTVLQGPPPRPLPRIVLEKHGDMLVAVGVENGEPVRSELTNIERVS